MLNLLNEELERIRKIMSEDVNFVDINDDFLDMVKRKTPDLYSKFFNLYRNKGLEYAKSEYEKYDPDILAKKQDELEAQYALARKEQKKKEKKSKIETLKSFLPNKPEMAELLDKYLLTRDFRIQCEELFIPQLNSNTLTARQKYDHFRLQNKYNLNGYLEFKTVEDFKAYGQKYGKDRLFSNISKSGKTEKEIRRLNKFAKNLGHVYDFFDDYYYLTKNRGVRMKTSLEINFDIREFNAGFSDEKYYNFRVYYTFRVETLPEKIYKDFVHNSFEAFTVNSKEDVINSIKQILINLNGLVLDMDALDRVDW